MPKERRLDPTTHDYIADGKGGHEKTSTAETAMQHAALTRRGVWWGDAEAGSRLHAMEREGGSPAQMARRADMLREAFQPLAKANRIAALSVAVERDQAGRPVLVSSAEDVQTGEAVAQTVGPYGA